jgi:uncharacterized protein (DUF433 family)
MSTICNYLEVRSPDDIRVAGTRVGIEHLLSVYLDGITAEELAVQFPTVSLEQIYGVLAYYWGNKEEVDAYLTRWRQGCDERYQASKARPESEVVKRLRQIAQKRRAGQ